MLLYHCTPINPKLWIKKLGKRLPFFLSPSLQFVKSFWEDFEDDFEDECSIGWIVEFRIKTTSDIYDPDILLDLDENSKKIEWYDERMFNSHHNHVYIETNKKFLEWVTENGYSGVWMREDYEPTICILDTSILEFVKFKKVSEC